MLISVVIITLNEETRLARTLDSVTWADECLVLDGGSKDRTVQLAQNKGARVLTRPFDHFDAQKNHAISQAKHLWVLSLDADEVVSPVLAAEIQALRLSETAFSGYTIPRINHFLGKPMRHGDQGNEHLIRLFNKSDARFSGLIHEEIILKGKLGRLEGPIYHYGTESLKRYKEKLKLYTDLEASRMNREGRRPPLIKALAYPPARWVIDYIWKGGFLDGWHGFIYHALSCYYGWVKNLKARRFHEKI